MRVLLTRNDDAVSPVFLQSRFWADFKSQSSWTYSRYDVSVDRPGVAPFALSVLVRSLGLGLTFAYVPHGPDVAVAESDRPELLASIAESLRGDLPRSCVFVRFDPGWYEAESEAGDSAAVPGRPVLGPPLRKASDVQPPDSVVLAIDRPDDELLAGMKPKWRYNVKLAEKKGVTVADEGLAGLSDFYALYETTAARDRIAIHPRSYYERLLSMRPANEAEARPELRLWIARHEGRALAAIITVYYAGEATYLYGASSDEQRNLMPAYALQWAAMRAARQAGCTSYDLYGIPPVDDPDHPMSGLYRFKTGFGGQVRHYAGAWDYVLRPLARYAFRLAERLRLFWHKSIRKRLA